MPFRLQKYYNYIFFSLQELFLLIKMLFYLFLSFNVAKAGTISYKNELFFVEQPGVLEERIGHN